MFQKIKEKLIEENIIYVYLNFIDLFGRVRSKGVLVDELIKTEHISFENGVSINGSLIDKGLMGQWLLLVPILETFKIITIKVSGESQKIAYFLCETRNAIIDSRNILKKAEEYSINLLLFVKSFLKKYK